MTDARTAAGAAAHPMPVLETDRLRLRPMTENDAEIVVAWRNSPRVRSMNRVSSQEQLTVVRHLQWFHRTRNTRVDYMIELLEERRPIGSVSITFLSPADHRRLGESGKYIGDRLALGKGYAKEAAACWLQYAFEELGLDCVFERTRKINGPNIAINLRLGLEVQPWPTEWLGEAWGPDWVFMRLEKACWERGRS